MATLLTTVPTSATVVLSRPHRRRAGDVAALAAGVGAGAVLGSTWIIAQPTWATPGGPFTVLGSLTAMLGTYLCLVLILTVARIPPLERSVGQDRLVAFHKKLAPAAISLIIAHVVFTTIGYASSSGKTVWGEFVSIVTGFPYLVPALLALVLMVGLSVASVRRVRSRFRYETWWVGHLYFYAAVALAFGHQITAGAMFATNPWARYAWVTLYVLVGLTVLTSRVFLPAYVSFRHRLRVDSVTYDSEGVVTLSMSGRRLDRLHVRGGQFFQWRFLTRHLWWQAHPYSLSSAPDGKRLCITVKALGDHSATLATLRPGTRVAVEGPYGIFHPESPPTTPIVAVAAGVGAAPVKAMLEDVPAGVDVTLIYRVVSLAPDTVVLRNEIQNLVTSRGWTLHFLEGEIDRCVIDGPTMSVLAPKLGSSEVFVCGPEKFVDKVGAAAFAAGLPKGRFHHELFNF